MDESRISGSFELGGKYSGTFNENLEPVYLRFLMKESTTVRVRSAEAKISVSVLDSTGETLQTLVPSSTERGSICSLDEGEYILMIADMGSERKFSLEIIRYQPEPGEIEITVEPEEDEDTDMTIMEFD